MRLNILCLVLAAATCTWAADSVTVTPAKPSTRDSLFFGLYNEEHCCVTDYYRDTALVADTTIILSYQYDDSACLYVRCLLPGSRHSFSTGPVKAGTYGIYKMESMYCPAGRTCPLGPAGPIVQRRVGEVTVAALTTVSHKALVNNKMAGLSHVVFDAASRRLTVMDHASRYAVDGRFVRPAAQ